MTLGILSHLVLDAKPPAGLQNNSYTWCNFLVNDGESGSGAWVHGDLGSFSRGWATVTASDGSGQATSAANDGGDWSY